MRITPSAPNSQNATTEILIQPLPSFGRKPVWTKYRSLTFIHFDSVEPVSIPLPNADQYPAFAVAFRFANPATGQQTRLIPLGTVQVATSKATAEAQ